MDRVNKADRFPGEAGFRLPAEWERHRATWISWPRKGSSSFGGREDRVEPAIARFIGLLLDSEQVNVCVWDLAEAERIRRLIVQTVPEAARSLPKLAFYQIRAYEPWIRDHGPIFLVRDQDALRERIVLNWRYNAWGGKYPPWDLDDEVPRQIARLCGVPCVDVDLVLEGGAIDVNGEGLLLSTESCLLNPNRNPGIERKQIEELFRRMMGIKEVIWLYAGIEGDDTDGHVDQLARFVNTNTVVVAIEEDRSDPNYEVLKENLLRLRHSKAARLGQLKIITMPLPRPVFIDGVRMPASYLNFYIANTEVIVPTFSDPNDEKVIQILSKLFPDRRVVGLEACEVIWGLGSWHCLTQQEPD